jgi:hypothetical protein
MPPTVIYTSGVLKAEGFGLVVIDGRASLCDNGSKAGARQYRFERLKGGVVKLWGAWTAAK